MQVSNMPILEWLRSSDYLLTTEEILGAEVEMDPTFKELDEARMSCRLVISTSKNMPRVLLPSDS